MSAQPHTTNSSIGLLILRVGMGVYMATHGWAKVQMRLNNKDFADPLGMGSELSLTFAALAEFGGALLVILGLATRFGALSVAFTMGVAAFLIHGSDPWTMGDGASKEPALLYMIGFLAIVFTGPGKISLDALLHKKWQARRDSK